METPAFRTDRNDGPTWSIAIGAIDLYRSLGFEMHQTVVAMVLTPA